ncbi:hypothetical protein LAZ67_23000911 [Cordylochernes scorpioides]|uniref:Uncharacterized protein n=1 Tax=Cordylochernes scorpioides TaxID=51811 RepID=A0ABY6LQB2_9ARAC|nr:hypothetical protein LAZ67_23000911 [Cordylochernes scorpioides]
MACVGLRGEREDSRVKKTPLVNNPPMGIYFSQNGLKQLDVFNDNSTQLLPDIHLGRGHGQESKEKDYSKPHGVSVIRHQYPDTAANLYPPGCAGERSSITQSARKSESDYRQFPSGSRIDQTLLDRRRLLAPYLSEVTSNMPRPFVLSLRLLIDKSISHALFVTLVKSDARRKGKRLFEQRELGGGETHLLWRAATQKGLLVHAYNLHGKTPRCMHSAPAMAKMVGTRKCGTIEKGCAAREHAWTDASARWRWPPHSPPLTLYSRMCRTLLNLPYRPEPLYTDCSQEAYIHGAR